MKFTDRIKWKRLILAIVCVLGLFTVARGSYAAYTRQAFKRGVVRNRDSETIRFTSNYLQNCAYSENPDSDSFAVRTVSFDTTTENISFDLNIYNYMYSYETTTIKNNLASQRDITYNLSISFSNGAGNGYIVTDGEKQYSGATTYTIADKTLKGREANSHTYRITFPGTELDKVRITVVATPLNPSVTESQMLAAVITPRVGTAASTFSSEGKFIYDSDSEPKEYDGFNYEISISSGEADAELSWKTNLVEIDTFFLRNLGKTDDEISQILSAGSLKISMNQPAGTGDYLIPFYIRDKESLSSKSWDDMKEVISFRADQK